MTFLRGTDTFVNTLEEPFAELVICVDYLSFCAVCVSEIQSLHSCCPALSSESLGVPVALSAWFAKGTFDRFYSKTSLCSSPRMIEMVMFTTPRQKYFEALYRSFVRFYRITLMRLEV
jgi:hypothetical protein